MEITAIFHSYMHLALDEARMAYKNNEVPIGAIIVHEKTGTVVAKERNRMNALGNPLSHAEILAIHSALEALNTTYLDECDLYVTLEPCPMCAQAIAFARIRRLYFGAYDPKGGGVEYGARIFHASSCHHKPEIYGGIGEKESSELLKQFFKQRR